MNKGHAAPDTWHPDTKKDREAIVSELREVLASSHFCNSKRYPALLEYVVEHTLNGNPEMLKERTLGVEVFGRRPDYDTNTDTVVRYTASEVRKRLLLYYSELEHAPAIRISLPPGSYIPEFLHGPSHHEGAKRNNNHIGLTPESSPEVFVLNQAQADDGTRDKPQTPLPDARPAMISESMVPGESPGLRMKISRRRLLLRTLWAAVLIAGVAGGWRTYQALRPQPAIRGFWAPVIQNGKPVFVCTGSVTFAHQPNYSGTTTATRDIDYSFVSMQIASAINQIGDTIDHSGTSSQLLPSASTPLTELREHSVILLGGYNNMWTMRFLDPLRFHFVAGPEEEIVDRNNPKTVWKRNTSEPYSSADDYAIVARFRDSTIDGWVVALAGLGRNGTEAAAQFASSPHYMKLLRDWIGSNYANQNVEAVLKVNVIDGKSGAPTIQAVHVW